MAALHIDVYPDEELAVIYVLFYTAISDLTLQHRLIEELEQVIGVEAVEMRRYGADIAFAPHVMPPLDALTTVIKAFTEAGALRKTLLDHFTGVVLRDRGRDEAAALFS